MAEAVQNLNPEQKKEFNKRLKEEIAKKLEELQEEIEKRQEATHIEIDGMKIKKCLNQRIPPTKEQLEEFMRRKKAKKKKTSFIDKGRETKLNSFIDKVFYEDGALQMPKEMNKNRDLASFIDKVFFEDGALQLENRKQT